MTDVEPQPEFRDLTEIDVLTALADPDPENPIAAEVARLISAYTENFRRHVEDRGWIPAEIVGIKGRCPIEKVAMRLTSETIRQSLQPR